MGYPLGDNNDFPELPPKNKGGNETDELDFPILKKKVGGNVNGLNGITTSTNGFADTISDYNTQHAGEQPNPSNLGYDVAFVPKGMNGAKIIADKQKAEEQKLNKAAENTFNKTIGKNSYTKSDSTKQVNQLIGGVKNGDLAITKDARGEDVIKPTGNFAQSYNAAYANVVQRQAQSAYLSSLPKDKAIEYLNQKRKHPELFTQEQDVAPSGVSKFLGEQQAQLEKPIVGGIGGAALAPETGGASVGTFLSMAKDLASGGYSEALEKNYNRIKELYPDMSDNEAYDKAHGSALVGEAVGLGTGALLSGKLPTPSISIKGVSDALSHTLKSAPAVVGSSVAASVINDLKENDVTGGQGVNWDEIKNNAEEAAKQMTVMHMALNALPIIASGRKSIVPSYVRPQMENLVASADRGEVANYLNTKEQNGEIPQGTAKKVLETLSKFDEKKAIVAPFRINEENKAAITGKLIQKDALLEQKSALKPNENAFPERVKEIDNQIAGLDGEINKLYSAKNPYEKETDAITGDKSYEPKTFEELKPQEREGIIVPTDYGKVEVIEKGEGENKTYSPKAYYVEQQGALGVRKRIPIEGESFTDKDKAQAVADNALKQHYYENGLHDNAKPDKKIEAQKETEKPISKGVEGSNISNEPIPSNESGKTKENVGEDIQSQQEYKVAVEPPKPISEMNSEEMGSHAADVRKELKKQDKAFEGKSEEEKDKGGYYNVIDNYEDLRDTAEKLNFIENSENLDELSSSAKATILKIKDKPNEYDNSLLNGIRKRAEELNIKPEDLVKEVVKKTGNKYSDQQDAEFMMQTMLNKLLPKEEQSQSEKESLINDISKIPLDEKILSKQSDADIENRMNKLEDDKEYGDEFNTLEKEMERRERDSVFSKPLGEVGNAVDALIKKEKEQPNGYGSFIERRDARETKEIAEKYLDAKNITDKELKKDFSDAALGNPITWYADGLKLRESMKEAANRGITVDELIKPIEKKYINQGHTKEDARTTVLNQLKPILETAKKPKKSLQSETENKGNTLLNDISKIPLEEHDAFKNKPEKLLRYIQKEATGINDQTDKVADNNYEKQVKLYGKDIVDRAIDALPEADKKRITDNLKDNAPQGLKDALGIKEEISERSAETLPMDEAFINSEKMGGGIPESERLAGTQGEQSQNENNVENKEEKISGVKKAITEPIRSSLNLPKVELPKIGSDTENIHAAKARVDNGGSNPLDLVNRILSDKNGFRNEDEVFDMQYYGHQLSQAEDNLKTKLAEAETDTEKAQVSGQIQQLSDEVDRFTEASQTALNKWGKIGNAAQVVVDEGFNPSREKMFIKDAYGGEIPKDVQQKLEAITKERDDAIAEKKKVEEQLKQKAAKQGVERIKKDAEKTKTRNETKEKLKEEEKLLLEEVKKAFKKDLGNLNSGIPIPAETAQALGKLAINYFKQGALTIEALVDKIHGALKDDIEGLDKKQIRDIIAEYEPLKIEKQVLALNKKAENIEDKITPTIIKTKKGEIAGVNEPTDFNKPSKQKLSFSRSNEWVKANQRVINAEYKIKVLKRQAFESEKNMFQKGLMWAGRLTRLSVLSGYNVLYKLAAASTIGGGLKRIPEQVIGGIYSKIFKSIAEKAPIEGSLNALSEAKFYKEFFNPKKFIHNSWQILKTGESDLSKKYSTGKYEHVKGLYLPTDLHQIIKDPLKRATFESSFRNGLIHAEKNGLDVNDPLIINSIESAAYKRANYEIFQEQNALTRKFGSWKAQMEKSGNIGATGKFVADFLVPVSTVPTNIVRRLVTTSPAGLIRGGIKVAEAYRKGIESLSNEQADAVMKQLKQGTLGTALWLVGWFGYQHFGGLYSKYDPNKKRKEGELASDEMEVNGEMIPTPIQHALPLEIIQWAATARRIHENYSNRKGEGEFNSIYNAGMGSIGALTEQIPVVEEVGHLIGSASEPYEANKLKEDVKRRVEPQILRETGIIKKEEKSTSKGNSKTKVSSRQRREAREHR